MTLDIGTLLLSYSVVNALCTGFSALVWLQNRRRLSGVGFWLVGSLLQLSGMLIILVGSSRLLPALLVLGNALVVAVPIFLYIGLERYLGQSSRQVYSFLLLGVLILIHIYFTFVQPDLLARVVVITAGLAWFNARCAWLLLYRTSPAQRSETRPLALTLVIACLLGLARIAFNLTARQPGESLLSETAWFETLSFLLTQVLLSAATLSMLLMVNHRLHTELEADIARLRQAEDSLRQSHEQLEATLEALPDLLFEVERDGRIVAYHAQDPALLYTSPERFLGKTVSETLPSDAAQVINAAIAQAAAGYSNEALYSLPMPTGRSWFELSIAAKGSPPDANGHLIILARDITTRKRAEDLLQTRLRLNDYILTHTLDEMLQFAIDQVERLTESEIGFLHFVEPDQQTLSLQTWSSNTLDKMCRAENKNAHYSIDQAGVWVDCVRQRRAVIHNDYASLPHRKGLPPGHAAVQRELVVPIFEGGGIVAVIGVGNRPTDYNQADVEIVTQLAELTWDVVSRKRAEDALRESEAKLRALTDSTTQAFLLIDRAGKVLAFNRVAQIHAQAVFGFSLQIGDSIECFVLEENRAEFVKDFARVLAGETVLIEKPFTTRQGSVHWFAFSYHPVWQNGEVTGIGFNAANITGRKQAEKDLYESQARLQAVLDHSPAVIYLKDTEGRFIFVNREFERSFHLLQSQVYGKTDYDFMPHDLADQYRANDQRILRSGQASQFEESAPLEDKTHTVISVKFPIYNPDGSPYGVCGISTDITERKEAESDLLRYTNYLEALRQISLELAEQLDLDQLLRSIVRQAAALLDSQSGEVYLYQAEQDSLRLAAAAHSERPQAVILRRSEGLAGRVLETQQTLQIEDYQRWEGRAATYASQPIGAVLGAPVMWGPNLLGAINVWRSAARAFTPEEIRRLEMFAAHAATAIHNAQLLEQIRRDAVYKTTLLQEVNHRVKNNLMAIKGLMQAELRYTSDPARAAVETAIERLSQRIDSLSEVHNLLSQSQWAPVQVSELVQRVFDAARSSLRADQQVFLDNPASPVEISPRQASSLALIVNELATNTFKYAFGERFVAHVAVRTGIEGSQLCLEYRDDGPGYPENILRLEKYDVGLYLIQRLARHSLGGSVQLVNDDGAVTRLWFMTEEITRT